MLYTHFNFKANSDTSCPNPYSKAYTGSAHTHPLCNSYSYHGPIPHANMVPSLPHAYQHAHCYSYTIVYAYTQHYTYTDYHPRSGVDILGKDCRGYH